MIEIVNYFAYAIKSAVEDYEIIYSEKSKKIIAVTSPVGVEERIRRFVFPKRDKKLEGVVIDITPLLESGFLTHDNIVIVAS